VAMGAPSTERAGRRLGHGGRSSEARHRALGRGGRASRQIFSAKAGREGVAAGAGRHTWWRGAGRGRGLTADRHVRCAHSGWATMVCAAILALAGLWAARGVMTPVAFALFIIALVWPLQRRLQTVLPQVIAVLLTAAVAVLAIGIGGWLVVWGFGGIAHWVIANAARLQGLYMHAADLLERRGAFPPGAVVPRRQRAVLPPP